ncbi:sensor histidine kinase, partial [Klebsiella pneumoniae]|uniref:sensor histidine kinase n=1 Tax=Klebsiella pneumoniae TaxID=573 RepID=UPI003EE09A66
VQVTDTGIGIAQKDLIHIFDPFYRGDTSRARNIGSGTSGLGLAIVKEITRIHRGAISVRSVVDKGTTIKISFPAVSATPKNTSGDSEPNDEVTEITMDFS